jgi:hypothetical protein
MRPPISRFGRLVLYSQPQYLGRSVTLTRSASNFQMLGFNDRAMSLRVHGRWRVCENAHYRGFCRTVRHDQPTLFGLSGHASSARYEGP